MPKTYYSIKDLNYKGRDVLVLVNFDVSIKNGKVSDDERIRSHIGTLKYLKKAGAKRILMMSHMGRPNGKVVPELSTRPVAKHLSEILKEDVGFIETVGLKMPDMRYVLLENIRFNPEEESKSASDRGDLAIRILAMLDNPVFINDGFATNHREFASVVGPTKFVKSASGLLLEKEIKALQPFVNPKGKSLCVLGGAKIEDKLDIIESLSVRYTNLIIGGGMIFTFFKALGYEIGNSIVNDEKVDDIRKMMQNPKLSSKFILPDKVVVCRVLDKKKKLKDLRQGDYDDVKTVSSTDIPKGYYGFDVLFNQAAQEAISKAKFIYWNGPMGVFENSDFSQGSYLIGSLIQDSKAKKLAGGGDTLDCIKILNLQMPTTTGGGASSTYIINGTLPGIDALKSNYKRFGSK